MPSTRNLITIFFTFLAFGARAFGGPAVQIQALAEDFVARRDWLDDARFRRALGVYQVLPGPEAHEMCCYIGTVRGGRLGGIAAGLGFMLPGLLLMLVASALYDAVDLTAAPIAGAMASMQIAASALILRASWRLIAPLSYSWLGLVALAASVAGLVLATTRADPLLATHAAHATVASPTPLALFGHGLTAGLVTFGGAYTAIPYVGSVAAGTNGWMTQESCLDGIAIASVLPAPLVIFGTFVGWRGAGLSGALAFTAGIFLPAFSFTFFGFNFFERLVAWPAARRALDVLSALAIGLVAGAAIGFAFETTGGYARRPVFFGAWTAPLIALVVVLLFRTRGRMAVPATVLIAAALGALLGLR